MKSALEYQAGGIVRRSLWQITLIFSTLAFLATSAAHGQALDLMFDLNTPASHSPKFSDEESLDVDASLAVSLGFYSRHAFADGSPLRWGIVVGIQGLSVGAMYSAFRVQGRADYRFVGNERISLSGGLALGLSFMSDNIPCNAVLCDLPTEIILLTPSLRTSVRISSRVSAVFEAKGSLYMTDSNATFPFKSGLIVAVGLEFFVGSGG